MVLEETAAPWGTFASPVRIEHLLEIGDRSTDGAFGFAYNYLRYWFLDQQGDAQPLAKVYLDEIGKVYFLKFLHETDEQHFEDVLCYFRLRFEKILSLDNKGSYSPAPVRLMEVVEARVNQYLACSNETS